MNYVAHAFLAPAGKPVALLGNLLGDFVKGPLPGALAPDLAEAVATHRRIDAYCDSHPAFRASRRRLFAGFSHYAGVIVDVIYDHLLCADWARFSTRDFDEFAESVYEVIEQQGAALPEALRPHAERIVRFDVLRRYRRVEDLRVALERLNLRVQRRVELAASVDTFLAERIAFTEDFRDLFEDLLLRSDSTRPEGVGVTMEES